MTSDPVATVVFDGPSPPKTGLTSEDVITLLRSLEGRHDVTMSISTKGREGTLMVGIDRGRVFLGLETAAGIFQFSSGSDNSTRPMTMGGQEADIENRYLLDLERASIAIQDWLEERDPLSQGSWERR